MFSTLELGAISVLTTMDRIRSKNQTIATGGTGIQAVQTEELQFDVHGLRRGSLYSLVVQAFNSKGAGPSSAEVQCRTKGKYKHMLNILYIMIQC